MSAELGAARRLPIVAVAALLAGVLLGGSTPPASSAERVSTVYAYLADNTVVRTDERFGVW